MFEAWKNWRKEDLLDSIFDYEEISFPHEQYQPRQVSEVIAKVAIGEIDTYRNVTPSEIIEDTKKQIDEAWGRKVHQEAKRDPLVQKAYDIRPETPNGK
ncbi:hypothetical protein [Superficieibacter sp. 1612_C1]|uniref:hypothetical protein n=1 Tax=Superficieibacter sp. 1612_C1 TaxID=2780382 RepID=UPI00069D0D9A|nr:hypothetical protein [Superficieibacter sp. 1612_C1]